MVLCAAAFFGSWLCIHLGNALPPIGDIISHSTWKMILITSLGVGLSYTSFKNYEGAGASKLGQVLLYMLICKIGASADFQQIIDYPFLAVMGLTWISFHALIMLLLMKFLKAPLFFMAVASQANVGGAASAPVVASAFHPALSTVGVMLGVAGYVLGTYAALMCAYLLRFVAGA